MNLALSIVQPAVQHILNKTKICEIRSWIQPYLPLNDLVLVENQIYLRNEEDIDPDVVALALVDVIGVHKTEPLGAPDWILPFTPIAGFVFLAISLVAWRFGVRRYTSTGT